MNIQREARLVRANEILQEAAETYAARNVEYKDNYYMVGQMMAALFPEGLHLQTADDWNRMHIFILGVVKQTRYATNWNKGGHRDSIRDLTVYCAMLEEIDTNIDIVEGIKEDAAVEEIKSHALALNAQEEEQ